MTCGKWVCKSHLGPSFLDCENPFLYSVFSNYFSPKVRALVCSVWGQECPWVLQVYSAQRSILLVRATQQEPTGDGQFWGFSPDLSPNTAGYPQPTGQAEPQGWRPCLLLHQCLSYSLGGKDGQSPRHAKLARTVSSFGGRTWNRGRWRSCPLWYPSHVHRAAWRSSAIRQICYHQWAPSDNDFHPLSTADDQSRMAVLHSPQMRQLKHKVERQLLLAKIWTQYPPSHISPGLGDKGMTH